MGEYALTYEVGILLVVISGLIQQNAQSVAEIKQDLKMGMEMFNKAEK